MAEGAVQEALLKLSRTIHKLQNSVIINARFFKLVRWQVGVTLLLNSMMQIAIKVWTFNEMNRNAIQREIKRLEVAIEKRD